MAQDIYIYNHGGTTAIFKLYASELTEDVTRNNEPLEVPGKPWNMWFDNLNIGERYLLSGRFATSGTTWDSTNFVGPRLDFKHQFKCIMTGINPTTGAATGATPGFDLQINETFNGGTYWRSNEVFSNQTIVLLLDKISYKSVAGQPNVVDYTISFVAVEEIVALG